MSIGLDHLLKLVDRSDLSSIGQTITHIIDIIHQENSTAQDLAKAMEVDPSLSANVLRLANSAFFGLKRRVTTVGDAILFIGYDAVKELALSQKVSGLFMKDEVISGYSRRGLWIHSLGVALCAKFIYSKEFFWRGDDVYMAGILHDLGLLLEHQFMKEEFAAVLANTEQQGSIHVAENAAFGFCHEDVGAGLAKMWNLPPVLHAALSAAERPELADEVHEFAVHTIYVANRACQERNLGYNELPGADPKLFSEYLTKLGLKEKSLNLIMDEVEARIQQMNEEGWF